MDAARHVIVHPMPCAASDTVASSVGLIAAVLADTFRLYETVEYELMFGVVVLLVSFVATVIDSHPYKGNEACHGGIAGKAGIPSWTFSERFK
jgi:hypothetical protein